MDDIYSAGKELLDQGIAVYFVSRWKKPFEVEEGKEHGGYYEGTTDPEEYERLWNLEERAEKKKNLAIVPARSAFGFIAIDADRHCEECDGVEELHRLEDELGKLPDTWQTLTPTKGEHRYFRTNADINTLIRFIPGCDVIGKDYGHIIAPPSGSSAGEYFWEVGPDECEMAALPEAWEKYFINASVTGTLAEISCDDFGDDDEIPHGARWYFMRSMAGKLVKRVGDVLSEETIINNLMEIARNRLAQYPPFDYEDLEKNVRKLVEKFRAKDIAKEIEREKWFEDGLKLMKERHRENKKPSDQLSSFHKWSKPDKDGVSKPIDIIDAAIAENIKKSIQIITIEGQPYIYENGVYLMDEGGLKVRAMIRDRIYPELVKFNRIEQCYKLLVSDIDLARTLNDVNKYPDSWVNCLNGMVDGRTLEIHPHSEKYLSINQIPLEYCALDPADQEGHISSKFLKSLLPDDDDREMFLEFCGLCLTRDTSPQKFMILTGKGGTGKSTALNMLLNIVGGSNASSLSLQDLNKRFYPTCLAGKILNACADIPSTKMDVVDVIKKITGEDMIMGEYKGGKTFFFRSYAKLIFSANSIPKVYDDKTDSYYRRLMILQIREKATDFGRMLPELLQDDAGCFLNMAIEALQRFYKRGQLIESENSKQLVHKLYTGTDSVFAFLEDKTIRSEGEATSRKALYRAYTEYCSTEERTYLSPHKFRENLEDKGYSVCMRNGLEYFRDVTLKSDFEYTDQIPFAV